MKKIYQKPEMAISNIEVNGGILAGSITLDNQEKDMDVSVGRSRYQQVEWLDDEDF